MSHVEPLAACQSAIATNDAGAAPMTDDRLYATAEPVYLTLAGKSSGRIDAIGPKVSPMRAKPTISPTMAAAWPGPNIANKNTPKGKNPAVAPSKNLRRPPFSASGPETTVKIPKNTTPTMSIQRKSPRGIPRPGTNAATWAALRGLPAFSAAACAASREAGGVPEVRGDGGNV